MLYIFSRVVHFLLLQSKRRMLNSNIINSSTADGKMERLSGGGE